MAPTPPRVVLDTQVSLHEQLKYPHHDVVRFYDEFYRRGQDYVNDPDSGPETVASWSWMFAGITSGADLLAKVNKPLYSAEAYQVTAEMGEAVTAMYTETAAKTAYIREQDMPSPTGFVWLDEPAALLDYYHRRLVNQALSWGPQSREMDGQMWPGARITAWTRIDEFSEDDPEETIRAMRPFGELLLSYSVFVPFGQRLAVRDDPSDPIYDDLARWLHCLWLFMDTEIVVTRRGEVDRSASRRAKKSLKHDEVRVVLLRRAAERGEPSGQHADVDWSCRWVVQGFDRHLGNYHALGFRNHEARPLGPGRKCVTCGLPTTHVGAFIKGPPGKPLKNPQKLYRLVR
jgi:hypothetical protein